MQNKYNCKNILEGAMQLEDIVSSEMDLVESIVSFVILKGRSTVIFSKSLSFSHSLRSPQSLLAQPCSLIYDSECNRQ
jgi:hypothetical protein